MKKSLIALLLVVALVVTVSVFAASAETTNPFEGQTGDVVAVCPACSTEQTWKPVSKNEYETLGAQMQNWANVKAGYTHFYFPEDMKAGTSSRLTTEKLCVNLNGKVITRSSGNPFFYIEGTDADNAPVLNLMDTSVGETGKMVINLNGPGFFQVDCDSVCGTVNVYSGSYIGSGIESSEASGSSGTLINCEDRKEDTDGDGEKEVTDRGGAATFNFYGGTLKGASKYSCGLMNLKDYTVVNIDGATVEGMSGGGTGGVCVITHDAQLNLISGSLTGSSYTTGNHIGNAVRVEENGKFTMSGGTLTGNNNYTTGGAIKQNGGTVEISGGTIIGTAPGGGAIMKTAGEMTISGGTITGTTTGKNSGGSIRVTGGDLTISGGTITGGAADDANGGNIFWDSTGTLTMTGGTVTKGTALRVNGTSNGNGGNIYVSKGTFNMEGGTVSGGLDTNNSAHAGNIYVGAGVVCNITGGTITGGRTANFGGNLYCSGARLTIDAAEGKTVKITNGVGSAGGNVYIRNDNGNTATITGPDVTISGGDDGAKIAAGSATTQCGSQIMVYSATDATPCTLNIKDVTIDSGETHTTELTLFKNALLNVSGEKTIDTVYIVNADSCKTTVQEGYTGTLFVRWRDAAISDLQPGVIVDDSLMYADAYTGTGTVKGVNGSRSGKTLAQVENNLFAVAAFGGFNIDEEGNYIETPLGAMPTEEGAYAFVRPYFNDPITLGCDTVIDINNGEYEVNTNGFELGLIETRSSSFRDTKAEDSDDLMDGAVTVNKDAKVLDVAELPNGQKYLTIPMVDEATGEVTYTARRVKVDIDSVSIKPATAAMYYTTNMETSPMATALVKKYGVVLSLVDMPGADFATDDKDGDGTPDNLWTEITFELAEGEERMNIQGANSALLEDILVKNAEAGVNKANGEMPIYANAYVCFDVNGKEVYVMAEEAYDLSLLDILQIVDADENLASHPSVVTMYKTWDDPMASWTLDNIKAAAEA